MDDKLLECELTYTPELTETIEEIIVPSIARVGLGKAGEKEEFDFIAAARWM